MNRWTRHWWVTALALVVIGAPLTIAAIGGSASAAGVVTVDNVGDPAVGNAANCPAVPAGTCTLRDAVAASDAGADTIDITVGPITLTNGSLVHGTASPLTVNGNGHLVTQSTAATLLHTNGPLIATGVEFAGGDQGIDASGPVSVSASSISGTTGAAVVSYGGGTSAVVLNSTIQGGGNGVYAAQDATVTGSDVTGTSGVGVLAIAGNAEVVDSSVSGGSGVIAGTDATVTRAGVQSTSGQAVLAGIGGHATVSSSSVQGETGGVQAGLGVGISGSQVASTTGIGGYTPFGSVDVTDSTITGGAYAIVANTGSTITRTELVGGTQGGVLSNNGTIVVNRSSLTGSGDFGASAPAGVQVVNSTIATNDGCGVDSENGAVSLVYSTVVGNGAQSCGFDVRAARLQAFASVVDPGSAGCSVGTATSNGYNFGSTAACGFGQATDLDGSDPGLGALGNNGGATLTQAPVVGSPLIDAIPVAACSSDGASAIVPLVDQRGEPRPGGTGCDIGAVEVQVAGAVTPPLVLVPRFTG